jgi:hypothetical protein
MNAEAVSTLLTGFIRRTTHPICHRHITHTHAMLLHLLGASTCFGRKADDKTPSNGQVDVICQLQHVYIGCLQ